MQVSGSGPPQGAGGQVVQGADGSGGDLVGEVVGDVVEPGQQLCRSGARHGQTAQRVAQDHHAGGRVDAVARDVADAQQDVLRGQHDRVVPVAADQGLGLGGPVAHGNLGYR